MINFKLLFFLYQPMYVYIKCMSGNYEGNPARAFHECVSIPIHHSLQDQIVPTVLELKELQYWYNNKIHFDLFAHAPKSAF